MRKIIYTRPDGGLSVVIPAINTHPRPETITEAQAEQRAWDKLPADAISPRWAADDEIPASRVFRNAWTDAGRIAVDMQKAREIHKNNLRAARAPKLAALDVDFMRAVESADAGAWAAIAAKKQALRDVTSDPSIAAATTPEELVAAIPEALK